MSPAEEVKSRLDIVDVINEYVPLKPAGANWRARCPFHDEKSASFMVSKPKQIWHCFGCGEGGDVFTFVMKQEGIEFPEALRLLAEKAGVRIVQESPEKRSERDRLLSIMSAAVEFWGLVLDQWTEADVARHYVRDERGLKPETIQVWKLGFAPDSWEALVLHLQKKGYRESEIISAGLGVRKMEARGRSAYDRFRHRIMFPITDTHGRVIGATGRILPGAKSPAGAVSSEAAKYVNTPETLLYHKGRVLYGLDKAKTEIRKQNLAVIVEGNMDVITSHQAGITNVIAASGTALTDEQASLLRRYTERLAFAFDADAAGEQATLKGLMTALSAGFAVSLIELPKRSDGRRYKDPDECVRDNPEAWRQVIATAEPVIDHYLGRASRERDLSTLEAKQSVVKRILPIIARLPDSVSRAHYLGRLSETVRVPEVSLQEAMATLGAGKREHAPGVSIRPAKPESLKDQHTNLSEWLLASLIHDPKQARFLFAELAPDELAPRPAALYREMIVYYTQVLEPRTAAWSDDNFRAHLLQQPEGAAHSHYYDVLSLFADREFADESPTALERALVTQAKRLKKFNLRQSIARLEERIRHAERAGEPPARLAELMTEFQSMSAALIRLDH